MQQQSTACDWTDLPADLLYVIATHTPIRDALGAMRGTCRRWYAFLSGDVFCRWALQQRLYSAHNPVDCTPQEEAPHKRARKYALPRGALLAPALRLVLRACVHCGLTIETRPHPVEKRRFCAQCSLLERYHLVSHRMALDMGLSEMDLRFTAHVQLYRRRLYQHAELQRVLLDKYPNHQPLARHDTGTRILCSRVRNEALLHELHRVQSEVGAVLCKQKINADEVERYWRSKQSEHVMVLQGDHRTEQLRCVTSLEHIVRCATEFIQYKRARDAPSYFNNSTSTHVLCARPS